MDFDIVEKVYESLSTVENVYEGWYREDLNKDHITFFQYVEVPQDFEDDEEGSINHGIQVDIWSKDSIKSQQLKIIARKLLKSHGFRYTDGQDLYETDTGIYHKAMRFNYLEEI